MVMVGAVVGWVGGVGGVGVEAGGTGVADVHGMGGLLHLFLTIAL